MTFYLTPRQKEAKKLVTDPAIKQVLLAGGSRSGKTAFLCYVIVQRALTQKSRHVILRYHFNDIKRSIGMDTLPKILEMIRDKNSSMTYTLNKSDWVFTVTGNRGDPSEQFTSEIWLGGLDDKERVEKILGNEYSTIYLNEASQISYHAYTTALTRLAENSGLNNKLLIDCNPPEKTHWLYQMFMLHCIPGTSQPLPHQERYTILKMNPADNPHLPPDYLETLESLPDRQKRRFLYGEWLDKRDGALVTREMIERAKVPAAPAYLPYAVVGIDPAISSGDEADETGIITVGRDATGEFYVLRDDSLKGSPAEWAANVNSAYCALNLDSAVYETNQGGDMVEHTIHVANRKIPCHGVRATRGKAIRAEPVVALYERGIVHHVGTFPELEDQLTEWVPGDPKSPDRMDALVWAITYLLDKPLANGRKTTVPSVGGGYSRRGAVRPPTFGRGFNHK